MTALILAAMRRFTIFDNSLILLLPRSFYVRHAVFNIRRKFFLYKSLSEVSDSLEVGHRKHDLESFYILIFFSFQQIKLDILCHHPPSSPSTTFIPVIDFSFLSPAPSILSALFTVPYRTSSLSYKNVCRMCLSIRHDAHGRNYCFLLHHEIKFRRIPEMI